MAYRNNRNLNGFGGNRPGALNNFVGTQPATSTGSGLEGELNRIKSTLLTVVQNNFSCQICKHPCTQMVKSSCGHKFCRECVDEKLKNVPYLQILFCPSCTGRGGVISYSYDDQPNYAEDIMLQQLLHCISPDWERFFSSVQQRRDNDASARDEALARARLQTYQDGQYAKPIQSQRPRVSPGVRQFFRCLIFLFLAWIVFEILTEAILTDEERERLGHPEPEWVTQIKTVGRYAVGGAETLFKTLLNEVTAAVAVLSKGGEPAFNVSEPTQGSL